MLIAFTKRKMSSNRRNLLLWEHCYKLWTTSRFLIDVRICAVSLLVPFWLENIRGDNIYSAFRRRMRCVSRVESHTYLGGFNARHVFVAGRRPNFCSIPSESMLEIISKRTRNRSNMIFVWRVWAKTDCKKTKWKRLLVTYTAPVQTDQGATPCHGDVCSLVNSFSL